MALKEQLKEFAGIFGRNGNDIGMLTFNESADTILENQLQDFFKILLFEKVLTVGGEFFINISPLSKLAKSQEGWYLIRKDNNLIRDDKNWNENWTVFANRNDDAIYFDKKDGAIYGSVDKKIRYKLANNLESFFKILCEGMKIEFVKYNFNTRNDDEEISAAFTLDISNVIRQLYTTSQIQFVEFFFE